MIRKRGAVKYKADYAVSDIFKYYKDINVNTVSNQSLFTSILKYYFNKVMIDVIENNQELKLAGRLGYIRIRSINVIPKFDDNGKLLRNSIPIDWKATFNYWEEIYPDKTAEEIKSIPNKKLIYHLNEHTDGRLLGWYWDKITCNVKNQTYYKLKISRKWCRYLTNTAKKLNIKYYE